MKYAKAKEILPDELIQEIQKYIQGQYLYIPKDEDEKKSWGENSGAKMDTAIRNKEIRQKFMAGYCYGAGLVPGLGTSECYRRAPPQENDIFKTKLRDNLEIGACICINDCCAFCHPYTLLVYFIKV